MSKLGSYISLLKLSHSILSVPLVFLGYFFTVTFAETVVEIDAVMILLLILCVLSSRAAGIAFNRYLDRNIDKKNPRTINRLIPLGKLSAREVLTFSIANGLLFIVCAGMINLKCLIFAPFALFLLYGYSFTKRFTVLCHSVLALIFACIPFAVWIALTNSYSLLPLLIGVGIFFWVSGFDILYAIQDQDFDRENKLYSVPAKFDKTGSISLITVLYLTSVTFFLLAGINLNLGFYYWIGLVAFADLLIAQIVMVLINDRFIKLAFLDLNGIAVVLLVTGFVVDVLI